jgi:hypothetical protein
MKRIRISSRPELKPPGMDPKRFPPEMPFYWLAQPRNPVLASADHLTRMFIKAMVRRFGPGLEDLGLCGMTVTLEPSRSKLSPAFVAGAIRRASRTSRVFLRRRANINALRRQ